MEVEEKFEVTVRHEIGVEEESHCGKVVRSQKILYGIRGEGKDDRQPAVGLFGAWTYI